uniref:Uncharacterized protein n=1 Tax=Arundo donax TaxID=35708 RepID=A0A0A9C0T3_ARUDO
MQCYLSTKTSGETKKLLSMVKCTVLVSN